MYDYFGAASDEAAAELLDAGGSPGGPLQPSSALIEAQSGDRDAIRRAMLPRVQESESGVLAVKTKGIGSIELAWLESMMTGEPVEVVMRRPRWDQIVAATDDDGPHVVAVTDELAGALMGATPAQLFAVAEPWSQTESFGERAEPEVLGHFLVALGELAQRVDERGERLYCWICL